MNLLITLLLIILSIIHVNAQEFEKKPLWVDNFKKLDPKYWNNSANVHGGDIHTNFDKQTIYTKRGKLILKSIESINKNGSKIIKAPYINTYKKRPIKYGRLDIKAKIPTGLGVWPAIWLISYTRTDFPRGEIDILEYIGCWDKRKFQGNIHTVWADCKRYQYPKYKTDIDLSKYHIYTLEWTKEEIRLKVDGETFLKYNKDNPNGWVFDQEFFLVLNVAFGDGWGATCGVDSSILPCKMKIDWIKYYKLKE